MVTQSIVVLLLILSSSALLLANDEKCRHGNPINNGTVINLIVVGLIQSLFPFSWAFLHLLLFPLSAVVTGKYTVYNWACVIVV